MKKILFLLLLIEFSLQSMSPAQEDLFKAAQWGNASDIDRALRKGANINAVNENGKTALVIAISDTYRSERIENIKKLIKRGANVNLKANIKLFGPEGGDYTALMFAVLEGNYEITEILINEGKADINAQKTNGYNALMIAAEDNNLDIVKLLVENGADIDQKNKARETAIDIAKYQENKDIVEYLEEVKKTNIESRLKSIKPLVSQYIPVTQENIGPGNIILEYLEEDYVPEVERKFEEEKVEVEKRQDKGCVIS